jgi:DNA-binding protein H-NS
MIKGQTMKLNKMTVTELKQLRNDVDAAIRDRQKRDLKEARAAAEKVAAEYGVSLAELMKTQKVGSKSKAAPKYRNPQNTEQTWTGRGRKPQWIVDALKAGTDITALEI